MSPLLDHLNTTYEATGPAAANFPECSVALQTAGGGNRLKLAYFSAALFSVVYFARPEDWIPGAAAVPFAKITGLLAIVAFVFGILSGRRLQLTTELRRALQLFLWLGVAIPFSTWIGGSFDLVVLQFSKVVLILVVSVQSVLNFVRLRQLIFLHTLAVIVVGAVSLHENVRMGSRMTGAFGGTFGNPNDLAASVVLVIPFTLAFLFATRNWLKKLFWAGSLGLLAYVVIATDSRGGFLSLAVTMLSLLLLFQRGQRKALFGLLAIGIAAFALSAAVRGDYLHRLATIFNPALDRTGSAEARSNLLAKSLDLAIHHPVFGIGPGQFQVVSGNWHVAHNSFTELAAEAGLPAAALFISMLLAALRRVYRARRNARLSPEVRLFAATLTASMLGLFVSLFFASIEYEFLPYFLVAYSVCLGLVGEREADAACEDCQVPEPPVPAPINV